MQTIEDFFTNVSDLIEESATKIELDHTLLSDHSGFNISGWSEREELTDRILRRKPSKDTLKLPKIDNQTFVMDEEKIKILNQFKQNKNRVAISSQLQRIQNNLVSGRMTRKSTQIDRSRRLMMKLGEGKQNSNGGLEVTSQQLHRLQEKDVQLKQILLSLARFYERERDENLQLQKQVNTLGEEVSQFQKKIEQEEKSLQIAKEELKKDKIRLHNREIQLLKNKNE